MTRAEFLAFLARCAADPGIRLSEEEAGALLAAFDRGELTQADLPMPLDQAISGITPDDLERVAAALLLAGLLRGSRERGRDRLRQRFIIEARAFAGAVADGDLSVADWQALMRDTTRDHLLGQAALGADGAAGALALLPQLNQAAIEQSAFLSRFADAIAAASLLGMAWSVAHIANRAVSYGGAGYSWWFEAKAQTQGEIIGLVIDYVSRDDPRVCDRCSAAEANGPYLPSTAPRPGSVCRGGGRCRCEWRERRDMEAWKRLTGR